ncbi:MAG: superinfection exclusion B family protein [bacterium]
MHEWILNFLKSISDSKKSITIISCIFFTCAFIIFSPDKWIKKIGLEKVKTEYSLYIGLIFLITGCFLIVELITFLYNKRKLSKIKAEKELKTIEELDNLDKKEIAVLREFFLQGQNTIHLPIDHPVVTGLLSKGIIVAVSDIYVQNLAGLVYSIKIADIVKPFINLDFVGLSAKKFNEEELRYINGNRPKFIKEAIRGGREEYFNGFQ